MEQESLYDSSKHVGVHSETGLPIKRAKQEWKKPKSQKYQEDFKLLNPWFCTNVDEKTGKRCGKFMTNWDGMFYNSYGMCEDCTRKYNPHMFGNNELHTKMPKV